MRVGTSASVTDTLEQLGENSDLSDDQITNQQQQDKEMCLMHYCS